MGAKGEKEVPWNDRLLELIDYKGRFGHCNVPCNWPENPRLAKWIMRQRQRHRTKQLCQEHEQRLKAIDFEFKLIDRKAPAGPNTPWEERLRQLQEYKAVHGHLSVKSKENSALSSWISVQRFVWKQGKLSEERKAQLLQLGFNPETTKAQPVKVDWEERFAQLRRYKEEHQSFNVPVEAGAAEEDKEVTQLGYWVRNQRMQRNHGKMREDRVKKMDDLGFPWRLRAGRKTQTSPEDVTPAEGWKDKLEKLKQYKEAHGTCSVPRTAADEAARKLSHWVGLQRNRKAANKISEWEIRELDKIGFEWVLMGKHERPGWQVQFEALCAFKEEHGHCKVPAKWPDNPKLAKWVSKQREKQRSDKLSEDRKEKLDEVDFTWSYIDSGNKQPWEQRVLALRQFQEQHGHCNVPKPKNVESDTDHLGRWLKFQKWRYKTGKMTEERAAELFSIGVDMVKDPEGAEGKRAASGAARKTKPLEYVAVSCGHATGPAIFTSISAARPHIQGGDRTDLPWASYKVELTLEAARAWLLAKVPGLVVSEIIVHHASLTAPSTRMKSTGIQPPPAKRQKVFTGEPEGALGGPSAAEAVPVSEVQVAPAGVDAEDAQIPVDPMTGVMHSLISSIPIAPDLE